MGDGIGIRHRPRTPVGHALEILSLDALATTRAGLERDAELRGKRAVAAARDAVAQWRQPTRPTMRALRVWPGGRVAWHDAPAPAPPGPQGAIVHPIAIATCDLDRRMGLGRTQFPLPMHFGHECVAEVLAVGDEVATVRPGMRVVVPFQISCGTCAPCVRGSTSNCVAVPPGSMYGFGAGGGHWGGAIADQLAVPYADAMLVPLPDDIDPAAAASVADNVSDAYRHVAPHADVVRSRESPVLIIGALDAKPTHSVSVALYAGLVAHALGLREVAFVDSRQHVRDLAEKLGFAAHPARALRSLPRAALVIEESGTRAGVAAAIGHTAPDGICSSTGSLYRSAKIPAGLMYARNISLHIGRSDARTHIPRVLELMAAGRLQPETVTTDTAPIDDAPTAIRAHIRGEATKTVLVG